LNIQKILEKTNISKENIKYNIPMKEYTSFKIGGPADSIIRIKDVEEIREIFLN